MKALGYLSVLLILVALVGSGGAARAVEPVAPGGVGALATGSGTAFTYQGRLLDGGSPASGSYDLQFALWDAETGGSQVGLAVTKEDVAVSNGLFAVQLDFGSSAFAGEARWLEMGVRPGASTSTFTTLAPRRPLLPAPYAIYASGAPWSGLAGVPAGFADGVDNDTTYTAGSGLALAGSQFSVDTTAVQARVTGSCTAGNAIRVVNANGSVTCEAVGGTGGYWSLAGNAGTSPATNRLGTTDSMSLTLIVGGATALRLEPTGAVQSPNLVGGYSANSVAAGVTGATVGGGGRNGEPNSVSASFGSVGGGKLNSVTALNGTVGGGDGNTASGQYATVPGGFWASATHYGELAYASGNFGGPFSSPGIAQASQYVLRSTTTDATTTSLFLDGDTAMQRITIAPLGSAPRAMAFEALVVALSNAGDMAGYRLRGVIKNVGGVVSLISLPTEVLGEDVSVWNATAVADDVNDVLDIRVTGAPTTTIRWVATVRTTEVSW